MSKIILNDNDDTSLEFSSAGKTGIINIDTTNSDEGVSFSGYAGFSNSGTRLYSNGNDGDILITNAAGNDFGLLQLGGSTSSYPSLKRSGDVLQIRLADDSAGSAINIGTTTDTTAGNIRWDGVNFQGYDGADWINLDSAGGGGGVTATEGADGYIAFFTGSDSIAGDNDLYFDRVTNELKLNNALVIGGGNPSSEASISVYNTSDSSLMMWLAGGPTNGAIHKFEGTAVSGYQTTYLVDDTGLSIKHNSALRNITMGTNSSTDFEIENGGNLRAHNSMSVDDKFIVGNNTIPSSTMHVYGSLSVGGSTTYRGSSSTNGLLVQGRTAIGINANTTSSLIVEDGGLASTSVMDVHSDDGSPWHMRYLRDDISATIVTYIDGDGSYIFKSQKVGGYFYWGTNNSTYKFGVAPDGQLLLRPQTAPSSNATYGTIYVDSTDSNLHFVDTSGNDYDLTSSGLTSSEGADGYVTFFTDSDSVAGDNDLYWDRANNRLGVGTIAPESSLHVANGNIQATPESYNVSSSPAIQFGDGDTGFYETSDDWLAVSVGSSAHSRWRSGYFESMITSGFLLKTTSASSTNPTLCPRQNDQDTGIGHNGADQLSLVSGGVEGIRITEDTGEITINASGDVVVGAIDGYADVQVYGQIYSVLPGTISPAGQDTTVDFSEGNSQIIDLSNSTGDFTIYLTGGQPGGSYILEINQHDSTPRTVTFDPNPLWEGGTAYSATGSVSAKDVVTLWYNGVSWIGSYLKNLS